MTLGEANPRVLIVTPEVTYLPPGMGMGNYLTAKAGGLADVSASLINALFDHGVDVHLALPDYRTMFNDQLPPIIKKQRKTLRRRMPESRLHLAKDRVFYSMDRVYSGYENTNFDIALAFQREVIHTIIPKVQPDLIHCNDWMTGLIPAVAQGKGIQCLFTIHNIYSVKCTLAHIEDRGINAARFWPHLFYENIPGNDEDTQDKNRIDFLVSGVFAAHFVNAVSPTFLKEIVEGHHDFVEPLLHRELKNKWNAGRAIGILNGVDPTFNPAFDNNIDEQYSPGNHVTGKRKNKAVLQKAFGLVQNNRAPVFFWPSRLDTVQKGCRLFSEILYAVVSRYRDENIEIVFVANGEFRIHFENIVRHHRLENHVAICDFDEKTAALAYAASDFILMPSRFEPCGLPQMIGPIYGSLPVAHDTGGIHDTITHIDVAANRGNGFLFEKYDSKGLFWAIEQAMLFYSLPVKVKATQIKRIMQDSKSQFNHNVTARKYIDLYEKMLKRPLVNKS